MQDRHLHALLRQATETMIAALGVMDDAHAELARLLRVRVERHWDADEHARYHALVKQQRVALRRFQAARRWHEEVRGRIWQAELGEPPHEGRAPDISLLSGAGEHAGGQASP